MCVFVVSGFLFFKDHVMYLGTLSVYMVHAFVCVPCACQWEPEEAFRPLGTGVADEREPSYGCWN